MASEAYRIWVKKGKPYKLAEPIRVIENYCEKHQIRVLGTIGNKAHLTADHPEDHTPFSFTGWPVDLQKYEVTAIDAEDDDHGFGKAFLAEARTGAYNAWLKYLNVDNRHYTYRDQFKKGTSSGDEHLHVSIRTDALNLDISDSFDPLGIEDMALTEADVKKLAAADVWPAPDNRSDPKNEYFSLATYVKEQMEALNAMLPMLKRVDKALTTTPLARIEAVIKQQNSVIETAVKDALVGVDLGGLTAEGVAAAVVVRLRTALDE